jgi:hypothetical protein
MLSHISLLAYIIFTTRSIYNVIAYRYDDVAAVAADQ